MPNLTSITHAVEGWQKHTTHPAPCTTRFTPILLSLPTMFGRSCSTLELELEQNLMWRKLSFANANVSVCEFAAMRSSGRMPSCLNAAGACTSRFAGPKARQFSSWGHGRGCYR